MTETSIKDTSRMTQRPRVVIVGAGFGGLTAAKALAKAPVDVILVDQHNYHVFQPLLYQVATAALSPADIASPIRAIVGRQHNVSVVLARVTGVDQKAQQVLAGKLRISFDYLVLATGAQHAYFGHCEWETYATGIKTIDDATFLRSKILLAFEKAELETDPEERSRLLTFVVVGGGATGVEIAGAIAELARKTLTADFRSIDPTQARVVLVEAGPRVLPSFDEHLSEVAARSLEALGVHVRLSTMVTGCDEAGVSLGHHRIEARTIVWGAGVEASRAGQWLDAATDRAGRVTVEPDLSLPGTPNVFVIGDTAHVLDQSGRPVPGVAPAAKQEGAYVAKLILSREQGRDHRPFRFRDPGALATIGRKKAVVQFGRLRLSGYLAWGLWSVAHIYFLIGFRNRLAVAMNWAWTYASFQRGSRLITGHGPERSLLELSSERARPVRGAA